jgi:Holliday junction resolvase-like predicted endonuclease
MHISNTSGRKAEEIATTYLRAKGYTIIARNWRHPRAEIDIIAKLGSVATCFEVKYRKSQSNGKGLDYITARKLQQMHKAARIWKLTSGWKGEIQLGACEVSGLNYTITAFIPAL